MSEDWSLLPPARTFALPHYQQPKRAYHNDWHVRSMLDGLARRQVLTPTLALAVWGHDLVYDPEAANNEARSAELFCEWLAGQGAGVEVRGQVERLILATAHTSLPVTREEALLVDADLSILGADPETFAAYAAGIRQEYGHVPEQLYRSGRRRVLEHFLGRERIYTTPEFGLLETQARANLKQSLAGLLPD